jgi:hypothetical protein
MTRLQRTDLGASNWNGKNILYLGTSIPYQGLPINNSYPELAANAVGATVNNQALSSSMMRTSHKDGQVTGTPWTIFMRSLCMTIAEKNYIIANWTNVSGTPIGTAPTAFTAALTLPIYINLNNAGSTVPTDLSQPYGSGTYASDMRAASYENRVLPFLPGTQTNSIGQTVGNGYNNGVLVGVVADLIVIDHGYNDNQGGIVGTPADTTNDFTTVPATRNDARYFIGAFNFLLDVIYKANPKARVAITGHYENQLYPNIAIAQQTAASYWGVSFLKLWEKLGWSQQIVPGTSTKVKDIWLSDGIHPADSQSRQLIADNLYHFFNTTA